MEDCGGYSLVGIYRDSLEITCRFHYTRFVVGRLFKDTIFLIYV